MSKGGSTGAHRRQQLALISLSCSPHSLSRTYLESALAKSEVTHWANGELSPHKRTNVPDMLQVRVQILP